MKLGELIFTAQWYTDASALYSSNPQLCDALAHAAALAEQVAALQEGQESLRQQTVRIRNVLGNVPPDIDTEEMAAMRMDERNTALKDVIILQKQVAALQGRVDYFQRALVDAQVNGHGWMICHDQLLGLIQNCPEAMRKLIESDPRTKFPSANDVPQLQAENARLRRAVHRRHPMTNPDGKGANSLPAEREGLDTASVEVLKMILDGKIAGRISEWPQIKPAISGVLAELEKLRASSNPSPTEAGCSRPSHSEPTAAEWRDAIIGSLSPSGRGNEQFADRIAARARELAAQRTPPTDSGVAVQGDGAVDDECEQRRRPSAIREYLLSIPGAKILDKEALADYEREIREVVIPSLQTRQPTFSQRVRQHLQSMVTGATEIVDGDEVTGYQIKTGALHKLIGMLGVSVPTNLPQITKRAAVSEAMVLVACDTYDAHEDNFEPACYPAMHAAIEAALAVSSNPGPADAGGSRSTEGKV